LGAEVFDDHKAELQALIATDLGLPAGTVPSDAAIAQSPLLAEAMNQATKLLNLMPPSALLAGIYAQVDNSRGVWKAPANVSLNGVLAPAVAIDNAEQEDLNISLDGKSVNAIRSFAGKGILVWGARTLDGNSNEVRYINVRRTLNMIEDSCQQALQALSFEPNTAPTWQMATALLENFLVSLWRQGALVGAKPQEAFAVRLGLGQTMTQQDLQDGLLKVELMLALMRPAEFVVVGITQKMQAG
jgi:phage tail sheath protein FI